MSPSADPAAPERPSLTRRQLGVLAIAWLGWVFDVADTALFNFAKVPMLTEMLGAERYRAIGAQVEGQIQAVFLLGWAIGGLVFGVLADRWGRTPTLVLTVLLYSGFTGLTALCQTPEQVALVRFLTALGIGGEWAAGAALVAETFGPRARASAAAALQTAAAFGPVLAALANLALRGQPWQALFLVCVLPALLTVFVRRRVHEPAPRPAAARAPLAVVFGDARWRARALAAMVVGAVGVTGAGTATFWLPNLVKAASEGLPKADLDARTSAAVMVSHLGTLAGVLLVPLACERLGRRPTIAACFVAAPLAVGLALAGGAEYGRLVALFPVVNFFAVGVSAAFVLYFPELFPSVVRATGAGLAYNVGRLLAIPMPIVTGWVARQYGGAIASGVLLSGAVYLLGLVALPFLPETRGQALPEE